MLCSCASLVVSQHKLEMSGIVNLSKSRTNLRKAKVPALFRIRGGTGLNLFHFLPAQIKLLTCFSSLPCKNHHGFSLANDLSRLGTFSSPAADTPERRKRLVFWGEWRRKSRGHVDRNRQGSASRNSHLISRGPSNVPSTCVLKQSAAT